MLPKQDLLIGLAIIFFGQLMGVAVFVSIGGDGFWGLREQQVRIQKNNL